MTKMTETNSKLVGDLRERAKELNCLYQVEEILTDVESPLDVICEKVLKVIPPGLQFPDACVVKIDLDGDSHISTAFMETPWVLRSEIQCQGRTIGTLSVYYTREMPVADVGPFLKEETRLISTIAERLGHFITHRKMKQILQGFESTSKEKEWQAVLDMLRDTDKDQYSRIARKMLNHLCWNGVKESQDLLQSVSPDDVMGEGNIPSKKRTVEFSGDFGQVAFEMASRHYSDLAILDLIRKWIQEEKMNQLSRAVNCNLPMPELVDAVRRYHHSDTEESRSPGIHERGIIASLIRRILGDQLEYINVAKNFTTLHDLHHLLKRVIFSSDSQGKLGGKSAGIYLADRILKEKSRDEAMLAGIKTPRTWYLASDVLNHFVQYNNLDEVIQQKYKELNQVRLEYPHIVQAFKSGHFPHDIINGLSAVLDDLGDRPIIVRSSSLLEDRFGTAFSGKYRSLYLDNRGNKRKRLEALMDAVAEVYASVFGPDPIEYRAERGLIDFSEEMGILIQEVVGTRVGRYFLPSYAGVAFSRNEFRWSPRIKREDGLIRIVPGLGTRAVDRLSDDYPVLVAPGQPGLRVNISVDEIIRYTPGKLDVIDLEGEGFKTLSLAEFLGEVDNALPAVSKIISMAKDGHLSRRHIDLAEGEPVADFSGLISDTPFVKRIRAVLKTLEEALGTPVDLEFASDGKDLYLLQCRPQCYSKQDRPAPIPKDIPDDRVVFSADRYVSNGRVPDITHIVYVDPQRYAALRDRTSLLAVGRAVGKLNRILPKRQFILLGPGRWGCRDDLRSGVNVTYSDINNAAVLSEIAVRKGKYVPELSFGTHFFQDLVEAGIRYLPLYPDDEGVVFKHRFFERAKNILPDIAPEYAHLAEVVRLIDVPANARGRILRVLMNAELDEAVGLLAEPGSTVESSPVIPEAAQPDHLRFWRWRLDMAERLAAQLDAERFGVAGLYVIGSTKNATAGPGSDIDLLVHFRGSELQFEQLRQWLEGWSLCLGELNYLRTGYRTSGLLDVHFVTDEDIEKRTSYATKIGAVTDPAHPLPLGETTGSGEIPGR